MEDNFNDKTPLASLIATTVIQSILIAIKLCGIVDWSWWIILLPIELAIGSTVVIFLIIDIIFVAEMYKDYRRQKERK